MVTVDLEIYADTALCILDYLHVQFDHMGCVLVLLVVVVEWGGCPCNSDHWMVGVVFVLVLVFGFFLH